MILRSLLLEAVCYWIRWGEQNTICLWRCDTTENLSWCNTELFWWSAYIIFDSIWRGESNMICWGLFEKQQALPVAICGSVGEVNTIYSIILFNSVRWIEYDLSMVLSDNRNPLLMQCRALLVEWMQFVLFRSVEKRKYDLLRALWEKRKTLFHAI